MAHADEVSFAHPSREMAESQTNRLLHHCADSGIEVNSGDENTRVVSANSKAFFLAALCHIFETACVLITIHSTYTWTETDEFRRKLSLGIFARHY